MPGVLLPVLIVAHVVLAVGLLAPSLLLPFTLKARARTPDSAGRDGRVLRSLLWLQDRGNVAIGIGVAATGAGLIAILGADLLGRPWLVLALGVYAVDLALAFFVQRPALLRLRRQNASAAERSWLANARRQRYLSYLMTGLVGTVGFLMSTKPVLW